MNAIDALWHLLNLFAPAAFLALFASAITKLLWRRSLPGVPWARLLWWAAWPAFLVTVAGLVLTGRDGKMLTYAGMVCACALGLWLRIPGRD